MNRLFLTLFISQFLFLAAIQAQEDESRRFGQFDAGVRLGISGCQIDGDNYGGYNKLGFSGGAIVRSPLSEKLDIQMELLYSHRGSRDPADPDNGKLNSYRINLNYIDIPLLLKFPAWKFDFEAGLCNGIFLSSSEEDEFGTVTNSIFNFLRYELALNVGTNFRLTENWMLNVRYHRSVLPIANQRRLIPRFGFLGGSYNDVVSFSIIRYFSAG